MIVTEKLREVVKQHQQHSKGALQEQEEKREGEEERERYNVKQLNNVIDKNSILIH